ncbi:MAG: phosphotransferase [Deltaproteobacteria bacterium]|nr:phosphotransferase [Deltaproteobacteria bacterium]
MRPFSQLTLRGRARRLRALAQAALANYDLDVRRLRLISNTWNCVFRLDTPRGPLILRVTLPGHGHSPASVRSEAAFLDSLARESTIDVPQPVPARDGRLVVSAEAPGVPEPRMCVVYTWIRGTNLSGSLNPASLHLHGELHARLHAFGAGWRTPPDFAINDFTRVFHYPSPVVLWDADLLGYEALFREALQASDQLIAVVRRRDPVIVTHGDLHQANALLHRGVLRPIDFEDLMWATRGLDVGTSLFYLSRVDYEERRDAFRAGYESVAPWPEGAPGEIDLLRVPRALLLMNFMAGDSALRVGDWTSWVERMAALARTACR